MTRTPLVRACVDERRARHRFGRLWVRVRRRDGPRYGWALPKGARACGVRSVVRASDATSTRPLGRSMEARAPGGSL